MLMGAIGALTALFALDIELKRGLEKRKPYTILHLRHDTPFRCFALFNENGQPFLYRCRFDRAPQERITPIKNDFFILDFHTKDQSFVIEIHPRKKSLIFATVPPIYRSAVIPAHALSRSSHWIVLGYIDTPPYLGEAEYYDESLSFPIDAKPYATPAVGAIDLNGKPVFLKKNRDVEIFIALKEAFKAGKYQKAYDMATEAMELYPRSIFASDFLYYRIKSLFYLDPKEYTDKIIKLGQRFLKCCASDEHLPEVLLFLARVYSANGFISDANYFFNRLIQEHADTRYADLGRIYLADQLYMNGAMKKAIQNYLAAYYHAKDIDVASLAAYKLAIRYFEMRKPQKAIGYLRKIWEKNPGFLLKNHLDAHRIAIQLASYRAYDLAVEIEKGVLKRVKKFDEIYEEALYNIGQWYDASGKIKEAIEWYQRYLKEFPWGTYSEKVKQDLDALFVVDRDVNASEAIKRYDALIQSYKHGPIADKALAAKIALLVDEKRYEAALALKSKAAKIKDDEAKKMAQEALKKAAEAYLAKSVAKGDCESALLAIRDENATLPSKFDPFIYRCDVEYADYADALKIAKRHLNAKNLNERLIWSCRALHALVGLEKYEEAFKAAGDVLQLQKAIGKKGCKEFDFDYLQVLHRLGRYAEEMAWIEKMRKRYGNDMKMADVYKMGYDAAKRANDPLQQLKMLRRLIALQNAKGSHPYSPWAEFEAIRLLKTMNRYDEALKIAESMRRLDLKGQKRARWLYEQGVLQKMTGRNGAARKSFEVCRRIKEGGAWHTLCKEALRLEKF